LLPFPLTSVALVALFIVQNGATQLALHLSRCTYRSWPCNYS